jgi:hypothetical protein
MFKQASGKWNSRFGAPPSGLGIQGESVGSLTFFNGYLVAGGKFSTAGSVSCENLALFDGKGWKPLGEGHLGRVTCMTPWGSGLVVCCWDSTGIQSDGQNQMGWSVVLLDDHFSVVDQIASGLGGPIRSVQEWNGVLFFVGDRFGISSKKEAHGCFWKYDGDCFEPALEGVEGRIDFALSWEGSLLLGGHFLWKGSEGYSSLARYNGDGLSVEHWPFSSFPTAATVWNGALIVVGSSFLSNEFDGMDAGVLAMQVNGAWDQIPLPFHPNSSYFCLAPTKRGLVLGGNFFASEGEVECCNIALWNGVSWESFCFGLVLSWQGFDFVDCVLETETGLFVSGNFDAGDLEVDLASNIAKWEFHD